MSTGSWNAPPYRVPAQARTVLVFGGSFDPPHRAHIDLPCIARERLGIDWLLYVPAARAPMKPQPIASGERRVEMLRLGLAGRERVSVCGVELARGGEASYTIDTLKRLRSELHSGVALRLCVGADQALQFHAWRDAKRIIELAEPVVLRRPPDDDPEELFRRMAPHWSAQEMERWRDRVVDTPVDLISSASVRRALLRDGSDAASVTGMLPESVRRYIRQHGLYRAVATTGPS